MHHRAAGIKGLATNPFHFSKLNDFPNSCIRLATNQSEISFFPFAVLRVLAVLSLFTGVDGEEERG